MKTLLAISALVLSTGLKAQINVNDSTVQVIAYWSRGDKQTYSVINNKFKLKGTDTTSREHMSYEVDVVVKDSTARSYTIEWRFRNINIDSDNRFTKKLAAVCQDMSIVFKTDEMGSFVEVVNWKEVRDYIKKSTNMLKDEFKEIPKIAEITDQVVKMFSSREAIESLAIRDVRQFLTYHGGKYEFGKNASGKVKVSNLFGGEPFDAELTVRLDEIDSENDNSIIRMWQSVDPDQLGQASFDYLVKIARATGSESPKREQMPAVRNDTRTASRIHGSSGWIIYSIETKEVTAEDVLNFEERIIELK
jgi:hypothetical protein